MTDLGLNLNNQDLAIKLMVERSDFLGQCVRKKIGAHLFSADVRKDIVSIALSHYATFGIAPGVDNLIDIIADKIAKRRSGFREGESDAYSDYIADLMAIDANNGVVDYIKVRIDEFVRKRAAITLANDIIRLQERLGSETDKVLELAKEALEEVARSTGEQMVERFQDTLIEKPLDPIVVRFNIPEIDMALGGGIRIGTLGLIQGYTNVGKSWTMTHLAKMGVRFGEWVLYCATEMANRTQRLRLKMCFTGLTESEIYDNPAAVKAKVKESHIEKSEVLLLSEEEKSMRVDELPAVLDDIEEKYGIRIRLVLLDSADDMQPPEGNYSNELIATEAKYTWLKNWAKDTGSAILTTVQSKAEGEKKWWLTSGTVGYGFVKARKATLGISLNATPDEIKAGLARAYVFKNTDGAVGGKSWFAHDFSVGQFVIDSGYYNDLEYKELLKSTLAQIQQDEQY